MKLNIIVISFEDLEVFVGNVGGNQRQFYRIVKA